ncbi:MAG: radical SAM protein [Acidobacteria bacterium]|nr:radical SAM protein [Acidobacteriota bacterium]
MVPVELEPAREPLEFGFQWHLTDRCNLRCVHCYQDDFSPAGERPLDVLKRMADAVLGSLPNREVSVNITGGEPLLVPHLAPFLRHLEGYPNLLEINLITNGTIAGEDLLAELASLGKLRYLKVSVEASVNAVNDAIRGRGNLERVRAGISAYRRMLPHVGVVLMATLGRHNRDAVDGLLGFARSTGAAGVIFERFVPLGAGRAMADQVLSAADWRRVTATLADRAGVDADVEELLPYRAWWFRLDDPEEPLVGALCNLGETSMGLMPDGTVYPCRRLPVPLGNVLADAFPVILERLKPYAADRVKPRLDGPRCGGCTVTGCAGCRALAAALTGDLLADDPQCFGLR